MWIGERRRRAGWGEEVAAGWRDAAATAWAGEKLFSRSG
uniref:Uncharacterized protein n=1 Tax=Arundo donax TaxID=35708 RepID=A0A0A9DYV1_ARUDO